MLPAVFGDNRGVSGSVLGWQLVLLLDIPWLIVGNDYLIRRCVSPKGAHSHFASPYFPSPLPPPPHFVPGFCIFAREFFVHRSPISFRVEGRCT